MKFSIRLKELREQKGLSQTKLANDLGVSVGCVGMWESTKQIPPANKLNIIADYFNVTVDYLLGREQHAAEWTDEEKALGIGRHPVYLSEDEIEWIELRSEILRIHGEQYLNTLKTMLTAITEKIPPKP